MNAPNQSGVNHEHGHECNMDNVMDVSIYMGVEMKRNTKQLQQHEKSTDVSKREAK